MPHPGMDVTRIDRGRVRLAPGVRAALELVAGDQVLAVALPAEGRVLLSNGQAAMARLTGLTASVPSADERPVPAAAGRAPGTGPRAAWHPRPA